MEKSVFKDIRFLNDIDKPESFYKNYMLSSALFLRRGVDLWNINPIKKNLIPAFNLDKRDLYYLNKNYDDFTERDKILARQNQELLSEFHNYFSLNGMNLDIPSLLMAIAVERVLKGFLLKNGYIIHKHRGVNRLTLISSRADVYNKLTYNVYSLGEFTKFHVLKATFPGETRENLINILNGIRHLKKLRDREAHLALGISIFQMYDILLYKIVDNLMTKAEQTLERISANELS